MGCCQEDISLEFPDFLKEANFNIILLDVSPQFQPHHMAVGCSGIADPEGASKARHLKRPESEIEKILEFVKRHLLPPIVSISCEAIQVFLLCGYSLLIPYKKTIPLKESLLFYAQMIPRQPLSGNAPQEKRYNLVRELMKEGMRAITLKTYQRPPAIYIYRN